MLRENHESPWGEIAIVTLCLAAGILPFVVNPIPVSNDLPQHVMSARVIASYGDAELDFPDHFEISLQPRSTMLPRLILVGAMNFLDPFRAAEFYLSSVVVCLWLSCRFLVRQLGHPPAAAVVFLPLAHASFLFLGNLPFASSIVIYPLLLGVLWRNPRGYPRTALVASILLLLYAFHVFAAAVGVLTTLVFALSSADSRFKAPNLLRLARITTAGALPVQKALHPSDPVELRGMLLDLLAILPTAALALWFAIQRGPVPGETIYFTPLNQVKAYISFFVFSLSRAAGWVLLVGLGILALHIAWQLRNGVADRRLILLAVILLTLGVTLPVQLNGWWAVGVRTAPFAVIAVLSMLRLTARGWNAAIVLSTLILLTTSGLNTYHETRLNKLYTVFLSGIPFVEYGSKILPVIEQERYLSGAVLPLSGLTDAYNVYRGGSNPYCFAYPALRDGSSPLRLKQTYPGAHRFDAVPPPAEAYRNVGDSYDYVLLFGEQADIAAVIEKEMPLVFTNYPLRIYKSATRRRVGPPVEGNTRRD